MHVEFLTDIANLRAYNYGLEITNEKEARLMIGNIIPAISSTNAFFAGSMLMEVLKYLVSVEMIE